MRIDDRSSQGPRPPTGLSRLIYRLPIWLYRLGLGGLLGKRFLLINHVGRSTGLLRSAVVEVVRQDAASDTYVVASGFGRTADWYRNLQERPDLSIQVGNRTILVTAEFMSAEESAEEMVDYARRHPTAARTLSRLIGFDIGGTEEEYWQLGHDRIPFVVFRPRTDHEA